MLFINKDHKLATRVENSLKHRTPLLPAKELNAYVERQFTLASKYWEIISGYKSPVYILDTSILNEKARKFKEAFLNVLPDTGFYYAVKSNNHPDVAKQMVRSGFGLDVSSGLELEMALASESGSIIFSGPGKTDEELLLAVRHSESTTVLIDSFGELARLQRIASAEDRPIKAGVRLSVSNNTIWRKFGIEPEKLPLFIEEANKCSHIQLCGIQFHSSWNLTPEAQGDFIIGLGDILSRLPDFCRDKLKFIDIGGGYWPHQGEWLQAAGTSEGKIKISIDEETGPPTEHYRISSTTIHRFAEQLGSAIKQHIHPLAFCKICFEPGRWICNDAMHLIVKVIDKKSNDMVITDAGTNAVGWERFETDYCPVLNLTRPSLIEKQCHIMGSLCTPHDLWGYTYWGSDIQEGDILMIPDQGAYTFSLRQQFIKPLPEVITI
ncbi:alanine racemase [bacterium]|nr:alanine racemase [bacterium]